MVSEVNVSLQELLELRRSVNSTLYGEKQGNGRVKLYTVPENGIVLTCSADPNSVEYLNVKDYINKPILFTDRRIVTHDFANSASWVDGPTDSVFKVEPDAGKKLIVTSIQVRFPKSVALKDSNRLFFSLNLYSSVTDSIVEVMNLQYASVKDLVKKTNNPMIIPVDIVEDVSTEKVVEIEFKYADPATLKGSPMVLRSSLGEHIDIGLTGNVQLKRKSDDSDYNGDECWAVVNGKQVIEF